MSPTATSTHPDTRVVTGAHSHTPPHPVGGPAGQRRWTYLGAAAALGGSGRRKVRKGQDDRVGKARLPPVLAPEASVRVATCPAG